MAGFGEAGLHEVREGELALVEKRLELVEILHHAAHDVAAVEGGDGLEALLYALVVPETRDGGVVDEREGRAHRRVEGGALGGGDVGDVLREGIAEAAPEEARRRVVLDAEELLGILLGEIVHRIAGEFLEYELLHAAQFFGSEVGRVAVEDGLARPVLEVPARRVKRRLRVGEPGGEGVEEAQPLAEVRRAFEEAPAVLHEAVGLGAGLGDFVERLELGALVHLGVEVGGAGEAGQLRL